jgi:hypothetical protein
MLRPRFRVLFAGAVAIAAVVPLAGCDIKVDDGKFSVGVSRGRATDQWTRSYTVSSGGRVEIINENGSIEARRATGSEVSVKAIREVSDSSDDKANARLQSLKMREEVSPDRVSIQAETGESTPFGLRRGISLRYEVALPPGLTVTLRTQNGSVRLDRVDGQITAASTNGLVAGQSLSGSVQASTVNGSVQMEIVSLTGDVRLSTVNGAVRLELPKELDADLEATTVNGGVSVDSALGLSETESRSGFGPKTHISGRLNQGGPRVSLQTTNGGVRVSLRGRGEARGREEENSRGREEEN